MTDKKTIPSPCNDLCYSVDGVCQGCGMTDEEANSWHRRNDDERQKIIDRLVAAGKAPAKK